jgi:pantoate--beta-alanine ligase
VLKSIQEVRNYLYQVSWRKGHHEARTVSDDVDVAGQISHVRHRIGIVPTMGALHTGHLSLVERSMGECDTTIATIYVNPTQFAPHEDFSKYPRTLDDDLTLLESRGCHAVFVPDTETIYPKGFSTSIDPPEVANELEGEFRPAHFAGVCTVVLKLFNITQASDAYFGLKDYQQYAVLKQMCIDLDVPILMHGCPTVREADGLAMSSRNRYLSDDDRHRALAISAALRNNQARVAEGLHDVSALEERLANDLAAGGIAEIQYAVVRDGASLKKIESVGQNAVALVAARVGKTRLIDNMPCAI